MPETSATRRAAAFTLAAVVVALPHAAHAQWAATAPPRPAPAPRAAPAATRVIWTLVGAGAGFGAGAMFGLRKFDDAIDSDRKVWLSAIGGAAAGAVLGATLSADRAPAPLRKR